jgi:hypothetical protein
MGHVLCLLFGHKKARVVFSSSRVYCARCGIDLGVDGTMVPPVPQTPPLPQTTVRKGMRHRLRP